MYGRAIIYQREASHTYLVRGVGKAASGEEQVGLVLVLPRGRRAHVSGIRGLCVGSSHHPGHRGLNHPFCGPYILTTLKTVCQEDTVASGYVKRSTNACYLQYIVFDFNV